MSTLNKPENESELDIQDLIEIETNIEEVSAYLQKIVNTVTVLTREVTSFTFYKS